MTLIMIADSLVPMNILLLGAKLLVIHPCQSLVMKNSLWVVWKRKKNNKP